MRYCGCHAVSYTHLAGSALTGSMAPGLAGPGKAALALTGRRGLTMNCPYCDDEMEQGYLQGIDVYKRQLIFFMALVVRYKSGNCVSF